MLDVQKNKMPQCVGEVLLTAAAMGEADRITIGQGYPGILLMERAGQGVADRAMAMLPMPSRVLVLCGPGNNGGDGFVAARILHEQGHGVQLALLGDRAKLKGDAAMAAATWAGDVLPLAAVDPEQADIIIDALFGAGLSRALEGETARVVERVNTSGKPVVAVDVPSGVCGDDGQVAGVAIRASATVTFAARKPGHLLYPGADLSGPVSVIDIGIAEETLRALHQNLYANGPALWRNVFPRLSYASHKYTRGHALVLSGGATRTGAARLAARAALRIGAGLVTIAAPPEALPVHAAHLTAIMLRGMADPSDLKAILADGRLNTIVLGPALGIGAMTRSLVATAIAEKRPVVLDADALTSFEGRIDELAASARSCPAVITPHEGEFSRIFNAKNDLFNLKSKLDKARYAAKFLDCVVLLKGADTVITAPDGRVAINGNGTPLLATAGSGDVLAGLIGGLLAQGMPVFEAACAGAWFHAEAAKAFGPGLIAEDLPEMLPQVLAKFLSDHLEPAP